MRPMVRALLLSRGVRRADVDDVVQEVFCGAWRSMQTGRYQPSPAMTPDQSLARWLYGIAWRQANHYRESAWVRRTVLTPQPPSGVVPSHEERFAAWEALQALESIPQWASAMLVLRYAEGYEVQEIADSWGLNINTAVNRVRLARQHFERRAGP
jgi:RNA polymerase sigma-70 factor (ECF subfamily)